MFLSFEMRKEFFNVILGYELAVILWWQSPFLCPLQSIHPYIHAKRLCLYILCIWIIDRNAPIHQVNFYFFYFFSVFIGNFGFLPLLLDLLQIVKHCKLKYIRSSSVSLYQKRRFTNENICFIPKNENSCFVWKSANAQNTEQTQINQERIEKHF